MIFYDSKDIAEHPEKYYHLFSPRTPEQIQACEEQKKKFEEHIKAQYEYCLYNGINPFEQGIYKKYCPVCGKAFYTRNPRRIYDNYYQCARHRHRKNAKIQKAKARKTTCAICGNVFTPARAGAMYCSKACKQKAYRHGQNDHTKQQ